MYPGVLDDIQRLFPQARITSGYRGPNNPLTRRNPNSAHAHGNPNNPGAVDVAPIPGVNFSNYVAGLKSAGIPVTGALDEQKHPVAWTTGPNWHVSLDPNAPKGESPYYKPAQEPDMASRAAAFNVNIPQPQQPNLGPDAPLTPQVNADAILGNIPALKAKKGPLGLSKNQWGAMLAALGDSIYRSMGVQSNALGGVEQGIQHDEDNDIVRQRLAAEDEERRAKLAEPPQFVQNLQAYMSMPDEAKRQYLSYLDATNPIAVSGPQGTQRVPRSLGPKPGTVEDGYVFLGGDPADANNWRAQ